MSPSELVAVACLRVRLMPFADALNLAWLGCAGAPMFFATDPGIKEHMEEVQFSHLLSIRISGATIRQVGARPSLKLGVGERQGGIIKDLMKKVILGGYRSRSWSTSRSCQEQPPEPTECVLGFQPEDATSLIENQFGESIGAHQGLVPDGHAGPLHPAAVDAAVCQRSFCEIEASQRIRMDMLRKSVPVRGRYQPGDLVSFILANDEGRSSLWLVHSGITVVVAEKARRPATSKEVLKKRLLELRSSRKRKRCPWWSSPYAQLGETQGETGVTANPGDGGSEVFEPETVAGTDPSISTITGRCFFIDYAIGKRITHRLLQHLHRSTPKKPWSAWWQFCLETHSAGFLVSRSEQKVHNKVMKYRKKTEKKAGRDLNFEKESLEVRKKTLEKRRAEWTNWTTRIDGRLRLMSARPKNMKVLLSSHNSCGLGPTWRARRWG